MKRVLAAVLVLLTSCSMSRESQREPALDESSLNPAATHTDGEQLETTPYKGGKKDSSLRRRTITKGLSSHEEFNFTDDTVTGESATPDSRAAVARDHRDSMPEKKPPTGVAVLEPDTTTPRG